MLIILSNDKIQANITQKNLIIFTKFAFMIGIMSKIEEKFLIPNNT